MVVPRLDADDLWGLVEERARCSPEREVAVDESHHSLSFGGLARRAERAAAVLAASGVGEGTRVLWILPTRIEALVLTAALARLGAVQIPLIPVYGEREIGFVVEQARPEMLVVPAESTRAELPLLAQRVCAAAKRPPELLLLGGRLPEADPLSLPARTAPRDDQALRWIFYTSGTTSEPKGALHSDATLAAAARGIDAPHRFVAGDQVSLVFPYAHIGGPQLLFSALMVGYRLILTEVFDPPVVIETLSAHGVTLAGPGPAFWQAFIDAQRRSPQRKLFPDLRALIGGGAAKPGNLQREARQVLGVEIISGYGLTECPALAYNHVGDRDEVLASDGRSVLGVEMRTLRSDGRPAAAGEEGEICVKGPMLFRGYLDPALDAGAFDEEGFLRTGDLGSLDAAGQLRVSGRLKDIIIRKGENISAKEVEDVLVEYPAVAEAAVVGLPDAARGERACAVVVLAEGAASPSLRSLLEHCVAAGLSKTKAPEQLEVVDCLPRNATGKVMKLALRARYGSGDQSRP